MPPALCSMFGRRVRSDLSKSGFRQSEQIRFVRGHRARLHSGDVSHEYYEVFLAPSSPKFFPEPLCLDCPHPPFAAVDFGGESNYFGAGKQFLAGGICSAARFVSGRAQFASFLTNRSNARSTAVILNRTLRPNRAKGIAFWAIRL